MENSPQDTNSNYSTRIEKALTAVGELGAAGETLCLVLKVQAGMAFVVSLAAILWLVFHGYSALICWLLGLVCLFQVIVFFYLSQFVEGLAKANMETLRTTLSCLCLSAGLPDSCYVPDDTDEPAL
jgi:hypothetical protein